MGSRPPPLSNYSPLSPSLSADSPDFVYICHALFPSPSPLICLFVSLYLQHVIHLYVSLCVSPCLSISLSLTLYVSVYLYIHVCLSSSVFHCLSVSVRLSPCLFIFISTSHTASASLYISGNISVSLVPSLCQYLSLPLNISLSLPPPPPSVPISFFHSFPGVYINLSNFSMHPIMTLHHEPLPSTPESRPCLQPFLPPYRISPLRECELDQRNSCNIVQWLVSSTLKRKVAGSNLAMTDISFEITSPPAPPSQLSYNEYTGHTLLVGKRDCEEGLVARLRMPRVRK